MEFPVEVATIDGSNFAEHITEARFALNTRKGYANDWKLFCAWCCVGARETMPASVDTVRLYLIDLLRRGLKISTAERRVSAIGHYHKQAKQDFDAARKEARELLEVAKRFREEEPRQMRPLLVPDLRQITRRLRRDGSPRALRDRAVLVVGLGSALRRCNLAGLQLSDVEFQPKGVLLRIHREKNDQTGRGRVLGLPQGRHADTCPVRALRDWLGCRGRESGPLFTHTGTLRPLSGAYVAHIVKTAVESIGLDRSAYAGHSLRAGFVTAAGESGASEFVIAAQTGHRNMAVLRRYFRQTDVWRVNAAGMIGL